MNYKINKNKYNRYSKKYNKKTKSKKYNKRIKSKKYKKRIISKKKNKINKNLLIKKGGSNNSLSKKLILNNVIYYTKLKLTITKNSKKFEKTIYIFGEVHGDHCENQNANYDTEDYTNIYNHIFTEHIKRQQIEQKEQGNNVIDLIIESSDYDYELAENKKNVLNIMRRDFKDCYTSSKTNCIYKSPNVRIHWGDPQLFNNSSNNSNSNIKIIKEIYSLSKSYNNFLINKNLIINNFNKLTDFAHFITKNYHIIKQGNKSLINDIWEDLLNEFINENIAIGLTDLYFWLIRFGLDAYTFLRILRENEHSKGNFEMNTIIYHAGAWHARNLTKMFLNLSEFLSNKINSKLTVNVNVNVECTYNNDSDNFLKNNKVQCVEIDVHPNFWNDYNLEDIMCNSSGVNANKKKI